MIRVGVVGTGYMGENHVRIYSEMEDVKLIGISDPNTSRVKGLAARYGALPFADHKKMFEKTNVITSYSIHYTKLYDQSLQVY